MKGKMMRTELEIQRMHDILCGAIDKLEWPDDDMLLHKISAARDALCYVLEHDEGSEVIEKVVAGIEVLMAAKGWALRGPEIGKGVM